MIGRVVWGCVCDWVGLCVWGVSARVRVDVLSVLSISYRKHKHNHDTNCMHSVTSTYALLSHVCPAGTLLWMRLTAWWTWALRRRWVGVGVWGGGGGQAYRRDEQMRGGGACVVCV